MLFDEATPAARALDPAAAPPPRAAGPAAERPVASLVLFVGAACRPGPRDSGALARDGLRSLWVPSAAQAFDAARAAHFDAAVVDHSMLDERGGTALARLRAALHCPIVMLAPPDRDDEIDEILALELGADAYVQRPVAPRRLRAHLAALMRCGRAAPPPWRTPPPREGAAAPWRVDRVGNRLVGEERSVELTEVQCAFLQCLLEAQGRIVPRARLAAALTHGRALRARSVDVYVYRLRKRLHEAGVLELSIESIRNRGYVLHAPA